MDLDTKKPGRICSPSIQMRPGHSQRGPLLALRRYALLMTISSSQEGEPPGFGFWPVRR